MKFRSCIALVVMVLAGCGSDATSPNPPAGGAAAPPPPPPPAANVGAPAPAVPLGGVVVKAEAGVGKKGQGYGGGLLTAPIRARFVAEDRINFMLMQKNLDLFKAQHDRLPNTHEEFMEKIISEGGVKLPELPSGESYFYDPDRGELMVRRGGS